MKKNISMIQVDSILVQWMWEKLKQEMPQSEYVNEFIHGLSDLMREDTETLMMTMAGKDSITYDWADQPLVIKDLSINPRSRKVIRQGLEISLTPKEFDILYFLAKHKGEVFTKEQIYQAVWEEDFLLADSNIMAFIRKLRKKIEPVPDAPEYILTIWGIGYKFQDE